MQEQRGPVGQRAQVLVSLNRAPVLNQKRWPIYPRLAMRYEERGCPGQARA